MKERTIKLATLLLLICVVCACGQAGALYLPKEPEAAQNLSTVSEERTVPSGPVEK